MNQPIGTLKTKQVLAAIALIRDEHGRILVQKRMLNYIPAAYDKWEFPGGTVEFGEHPEDAVRREVLEEIGCTVEVARLLPQVVSNMWPGEDGVAIQAVVLCFECRIISGTPKAAHSEVGEIRFCTIEELRTLDILPGNLEFAVLVQ